MFNRLTAICTSLVFLLLSADLFAQVRSADIRIVQGDTYYYPKETAETIVLEKKTFRIQVLLQGVKGVYVFASFGDSLYRLPVSDPVPGFASLPEMTMAEEEFNKEKEMIVDDGGWSYWFFDPQLNWHRFNKKIILLDSGRLVGTKTIKQLYIPALRDTRKLKDNNDPLYLFFTVPETESASGKPEKELLRRRIKIEWREED